MNQTEHLLTTLMEECAEIQQACSKALRFGLDDTYRDAEYGCSPREMIFKELQDLLGVSELLSEAKVLPVLLADREMIDAKKVKVTQFGFNYAREQGTLT